MSERYSGLTKAQEAVLVALTDQRCANLLQAADFIADLPDTTKTFLLEARPEEIQKLQDAMRLAVATETVSAAGQWIAKAVRKAIFIAFWIITGFLFVWQLLPSNIKSVFKQ